MRQAKLENNKAHSKLFLSRATWSFLDQAIVSLGTFLVSIILARQLASAEYGVFALLLALAVGGQLLTTWLAAYPLAIRLASASAEQRAQLSTSSILFVAVACVPLSVAVGLVLDLFSRPDLILPGVGWFLVWQIQQATRRALLADLRHQSAVIGDAVSYLGQVVGVGLVATVSTLSLEGAFYCMASAAAVGAIVQASKLRFVVHGLDAPHRWLIENAQLGGWSFAANSVSTFRGYTLFWLLAALSGTAMVASFQAALNIFLLLNPVYISLANLIPQVAARAFERSSRHEAWLASRRYLLVALPPTLLYVAFAVSFPESLLLAFYGANSPYLGLGYLFPALAVFAAAMIPSELIVCYLFGIRETRLAFKINVLGAGIVAVSVPPFFTHFDYLQGACLALAAGEIVRLAASVFWLRQLAGIDREPHAFGMVPRKGKAATRVSN